MHMTLVPNPDTSMTTCLSYKIARVVYAESGATSLPLVEAFTSMIKNLSIHRGIDISDLIQDSTIFPSLDVSDAHHNRYFVSANSRGFQMCVRTASRMLTGVLGDCCYGATRYHRANIMPSWAVSRGYIADIDGFLFYR